MRIHSIKAKLILLIVVAFVVTIGFVIGLQYTRIGEVRRQLAGRLNQAEYDMYSLKLQMAVRLLDPDFHDNGEPEANNAPAVSLSDPQKAAIKAIRQEQAGNGILSSEKEGVSLFILDQDGLDLLHLNDEPGSASLVSEPFMDLLRNAQQDHFTTHIDGDSRWLRWEKIAGWNWYVVYSVPESVKLTGGQQVNKTLTQLNWELGLIMLGIALLAIAAQIALVGKLIVTPILDGVKKLTDVAVMGNIDSDVDINLRRRNDEIGQLARAVQAIIGGQRQQVLLIDAIAEGDWTLEAIPRSDQDRLAQGLTAMIRQVNRALQQVLGTAQSVDSGSNQIANASQALSQGATEQAASLEQITSSLAEMGVQTRNNAENATEANQLSCTVQESAESGDGQMQEMLEAMNEIDLSSRQISKIIKVIDDIAFQTNLLALNAAVEAARAGRHGRGFAVVADEVRNLAVRSAQAANETAELIEGARKRVNNGTEIANATAKSLQDIVNGINRVSSLVNEIALSSNEQAQGIAQINQGLVQVGSVTQHNTANAEETASSAAELGAQVSTLRQLLSRFKLKKDAAVENKTFDTRRKSAPRQSHSPADLSDSGTPQQPEETADLQPANATRMGSGRENTPPTGGLPPDTVHKAQATMCKDGGPENAAQPEAEPGPNTAGVSSDDTPRNGSKREAAEAADRAANNDPLDDQEFGKYSV